MHLRAAAGERRSLQLRQESHRVVLIFLFVSLRFRDLIVPRSGIPQQLGGDWLLDGLGLAPRRAEQPIQRVVGVQAVQRVLRRREATVAPGESLR